MSTVTESNNRNREIVAHNLTAAREAMGLSKRRMARETGIDESQLRQYESARKEPTARTLLRLAHHLGQSLEWFYENHDGGGPDG